ncbi:unnamed protein product [Linum trigynum]|uniref:Uncharacterized protein n=1 Tax=Linum trigynum TaxID=586398 RepID=A0AAV2DQ37_9ROSI
MPRRRPVVVSGVLALGVDGVDSRDPVGGEIRGPVGPVRELRGVPVRFRGGGRDSGAGKLQPRVPQGVP